MIDDEKTFLPLVHFDATHQWPELLRLCPRYLNDKGLARLQPLLNSTVKAVAIEYHYIDKDYRDTFSGFHSKKFVTPEGRCIRLHFFREPITKSALRAKTIPKENYVGYAVIRTTRPNCLGRTLLDPSRIEGVSGNLCRSPERVSIQGTEFELSGFPFISQDGDATVCAEAATWMILRYFSNRHAPYREVHPFQITNFTQNYAFGQRVYPSHGLQLWQMAEALRREGFSPVTYSRKSFTTEVFDDLLYTYIESGFPVFVALNGHVVVAIGHRSDYNKALPAGQSWLKTSFFNEAFVINDDNFYPYQLLGRSVLTAEPLHSLFDFSKIEAFTVPLPEKVFLSAEAFMSLVEALVLKSQFGVQHHSPQLQQSVIVTRNFLTTCKSFKEHLAKRGMGHATVVEIYHNLPLPHFIWVCELSTPAEYGTHKILGEVIWDATRNSHEQGGFLTVHYPEKLLIDVGSAFNKAESFNEWPLTGSTSYPLLRSNLTEV